MLCATIEDVLNSITMPEKEIGKVTHYFNQIGVAVLELSGELKVGDKIKIVSGNGEFEQEVDSMQVDHQPVETAKKGDAVGLKVKESVHEGNKVFLLE